MNEEAKKNGIGIDDPGVESGPEVEAPPEIDEIKLQMLLSKIRDDQSLFRGIIGGIVAAAIGAGIWAAISALTGYQIGYIAVAVGILVGLGVRFMGQGIDKSFGIAGAALALLGCVAGNLLAVLIMISQYENMPFFQLLSRLNPDLIFRLMRDTFSPMDLLFYAIAVYEGYKFSIRKITTEEMAGVTV